jgi:hypothetical protein
MKKLITYSFIIGLGMLAGTPSTFAQRVVVTRTTVVIPPPNSAIAYTNGYWKWSHRLQRHIWVAHPRARVRIQRGYRVRL